MVKGEAPGGRRVESGACFAAGLCKPATMNCRSILVWAGILGATGMGLGAGGAHGLREFLLAHGTANAWETAVRYHLLHAVALIALGAWVRADPRSASGPVGVAWCWVAGTLLFSGSLYGYAIGGPHGLVYVTPLGGLTLLAGWVLLIVAALRLKPANESSGPRV